jgi:predicted nucleic acid-binding protein
VTVVSNTSPLNYLLLIGEVEILHDIFKQVRIPQAVRDEMQADGAPALVRAWMQAPPNWLLVEREEELQIELLQQPNQLDDGEVRAISLAKRLSADLLLIDDRAGRETAQALGLNTTGTLGVLDRADELGILADLPACVDRLLSSGFRAKPDLRQNLLRRHQARR